MLTVQEAISMFGVEIDPHLEREVTIPFNTGAQRQGDVMIRPTPSATVKDGKQIPKTGVPVVRGENGGNTHLLLADGEVLYQDLTTGTTRRGSLDIGVFTVSEGSTAVLAHPEHGYLGVAPGTYTVTRQREQAEEIRTVAD